MVICMVFYLSGYVSRWYLILVQLKWITDIETPWFLLTGFLRFEQYGSSLSSIPLIAIERTFATYYMSDYESQNRPWIAIFSFIFVFIYTQIFIIPITFFGFDLFFVVGWSLSWSVLGNILLYFLYKHNSRELRRLNWQYENLSKKRKIEYTLGKKFQIEENIKITKYLMCLGLMLIMLIIIVLMTMFIPSISLTYSTFSQYIFALFDLSLAVASIIFPLFCLYFLNADKKIFKTRKKPKTSNVVKVHDEAKEYFSQLQKSWSF